MDQHVPNEPGASDIHLQDYLRMVFKHKWLIIQVTAVFTVTALVFAYTQTSLYRASGTMLFIKTPGGLVRSFQEAIMYARTSQVDTYLELLKSYIIMESTIEYAKVQDLKIRSGIAADDSTSSGHMPPAKPAKADRLYVSDMSPGQLRATLQVSAQKSTSMIAVSSTDVDPHRAADIINYVIHIFIEETYRQATESLSDTKVFISKQLHETLNSLHAAEERLKAYKEKLTEEKHVINLSKDSSSRISRIAGYQSRIKETQIEVQETEARILELMKELEVEDETLITSWNTLENPVIRNYQGRIASLEITLAKKLLKYQESHPAIISIRTEIQGLEDHIASEVDQFISSREERLNPYYRRLQHDIIQLQISITGYVTRIKALERSIQEEEKTLENLPEDELVLSRLNRDVRVNANNYYMIKRKYAETEIAEVAKGKDLRIIDTAKVPGSPLPQRKRFKVILGFLMGFGFGISLAFLIEYFDTSLKTVQEAEQLLGINTLGVIPLIKTEEVAAVSDDEGLHRYLVTHHKPTAIASEAYRILRTNLLYQKPDSPIRSLLITSANPLEGKTLSVSNLGISLAQAGMNVLLVDTDLRKPNLHSIFGLDNNRGFSSFFLKGGDLKNYTQDPGVPGLHVLTTGPLPPNPSELLSSTTMRKAVQQMHTHYDFIIFDSPPLVSVTDGAIIGSLVDAVLLVIELERHSREAVLMGKRLLDNVKAPATGLIFNKTQLSSRYGYYYYYQYKSYGAQG